LVMFRNGKETSDFHRTKNNMRDETKPKFSTSQRVGGPEKAWGTGHAKKVGKKEPVQNTEFRPTSPSGRKKKAGLQIFAKTAKEGRAGT